MKVMKYIELNPVRANMVDLPNYYRWSSFCHNSGEKQIKLIEFHPCYLALGLDITERVQSYIDLFKYELAAQDIKHTRDTWQTGTPLGHDVFIEKIER